MKKTSLNEAAARGRIASVETLLAQGADPNEVANDGQTALYRAAEEGHAEVAGVLLKAGADPNRADHHHRTPLTQAVWLGHDEVVRLLLDAGAHVEGYGHGAMTPLMVAVHEGKLEMVERLVEAGADVRACTTEGGTALHQAAAQGRSKAAQLLLDRGADIDAATEDGHTPLHLAIRQAKVGLVRLLIEDGANVNATTKDGRTPLLEAVLLGRKRLVRVFLDAQADPNVPFQGDDDFRPELSRGATPLMVAAHQGKLDIVTALLEAGADPNAVNDRGHTALEIAEGLGHGPVIDHLRSVTKKAESRPDDSRSLGPRLVRSARMGLVVDVRALLAAGADPDSRDPQPIEQGRTALIAACQEGRLACVEALIAAGADVEKTTVENAWLGGTTTPLMTAALEGHAPIVQVLLAAGARVDAVNSEGDTALRKAAQAGQAEIVGLLVAAGADAFHVPPRGEDHSEDDEEGGVEARDALTLALDQGHTPVLEVMLQAGVKPSPMALVVAARRGDAALVRRLIDLGLDVNGSGPNGEMPLHAVCGLSTTVVEHDPKIQILDLEDNGHYLDQAASRQVETVRLLLERGADPNAKDARGRTPLHVAATMQTAVTYQHVKNPEEVQKHTCNEIDTAPIARLLVERGADPNVQDREGLTPLMLACRVDARWGSDPSNLIEVLIAAGADPNRRDAKGQTALFPSYDTSLEAIRLLLAAGADVHVRDAQGRTPLLQAIDQSSDDLKLIRALIEAGSDVNARDASGRSALELAQDRREKKLVKLLKEAGAVAESSQHRRLFDAVAEENLPAIRKALKAGADPHHRVEQCDAFGLAVARGRGEVLSALLAAGADVNRVYPEQRARTPLLIALESDQIEDGPERREVVRLLLERGADPNSRGRKGWSPLTYAGCHRDIELVEALRSAGARVDDDPVAVDFLNVLKMREREGTPTYEQAVALVTSRTGGEPPKPIEWLPGARAFFVTAQTETDEAMRQANQPGAARFGVEWNVLNAKVRRLQEAFRPELAPLGATVIDMGRPIGCGPSGKFLVVLPTTDLFTMLAACGPAPGGAYGVDGLGLPDVVAWFRQLHLEFPFTLWGAGRDFVEITFDRPITEDQSRDLANRVFAFCPDSVHQGAGTKAKLARSIRENGGLYFWWD
jgi:ankyrin repeat protein